MATIKKSSVNSLWEHHHGQWRQPEEIVSTWQQAAEIDLSLLKLRVSGDFWEALQDTTLIISREYEHMLIALSVLDSRPRISYFKMPHPSGIAFDEKQELIYIASTRNPNQIYDLAPVDTLLERLDRHQHTPGGQPLIPIRSRFYPGCLYIHDLAIVAGNLHANAVGQNAVIKLNKEGAYEHVWWPACIEGDTGPVFGQNHIQLNSIAAGANIRQSYFSASCDQISARRPGHKNFPVDKRGVIFSGKTREPCVRGLTRPHSARLKNKLIWVDNSGYGEFGFADNGLFRPIIRLPGWTRGLCFKSSLAFVGTSRVIPRFSQYAPGLDLDKSQCGVHVVDLKTGKLLGSIVWPSGNQIFAVEAIPNKISSGFPFLYKSASAKERKQNLFYSFSIRQPRDHGGRGSMK